MTNQEPITPQIFPLSRDKKNSRIHRAYVNTDIKSILFDIEYPKPTSVPDRLLKYYNLNKNAVDALCNNYLWAANPLTFNDPFDCSKQLWDSLSFSARRMKNIFPNSPFFHIEPSANFEFISDTIIAGTGVVCLNEKEEENQDIIWGYYTNQHGFSITFNTHFLVQEYGKPFKIEYTETLDQFELQDNFFAQTLRWATQKKKIWMHETEWRFIFPTLRIETLRLDAFKNERRKKYPRKAIEAITLGLKFFPMENSVQKDYTTLIFIADSTNHIHHISLLSFLDQNSDIKVYHMFFQKDLILRPRQCEVLKTGECQFLIKYTE